MRRLLSAPTARPPATAARAHVVGLVLLALLLQAFSPMLHARLAVHAASTGQRIDVAAFCLPGHALPVPAANPDDAPPLPDADTCQLCQGSAPPAADVPAASAAAAPQVPVVAALVMPATAGIRTSAVPPAHRPRGPPPV